MVDDCEQDDGDNGDDVDNVDELDNDGGRSMVVPTAMTMVIVMIGQ